MMTVLLMVGVSLAVVAALVAAVWLGILILRSFRDTPGDAAHVSLGLSAHGMLDGVRGWLGDAVDGLNGNHGLSSSEHQVHHSGHHPGDGYGHSSGHDSCSSHDGSGGGFDGGHSH